MKAKGFTLIELLAVIVILAIIALIATPIVLGIIEDTKKSAQLRSAEMYLDGVEQAIMKENMNNDGNFKPSSCNITKEGNVYCPVEDVLLEIEVDGEKPKDGNITFEEGKIKEVTLNYTNSTIVKNEEGNLVYSDEESDSGSEEEETLAPGIYDAEGNMIYSWEDLVENNLLTVDGTTITGFTTEYIGEYKLVISNEISDIGESSFSGANFGFVEISNSVVNIGNNAFNMNNSLETVKISKNTVSFGDGAFNMCMSLSDIEYDGTMEQWESISKEGEWNIMCPEITVHCTDGDIVIPAN